MKLLQVASVAIATTIALTLGFAARPMLGNGAPGVAMAATPAIGDPSTARAITVLGHGEIAVAPDIARATFGVETTGSEVAAVQADNAARTNAVLDQLKALGIAERDLRTTNYSIAPEYDRDNTRTGFRVTNQITATVRDLGMLGEIIDRASVAGANRISGIAFDVSNRRETLASAREAAMQDARAKAEHYAQLAGVALGEPWTIAEQAATPMAELPLRQVAAGDTPIATGASTVAVSVQVSYAIR